MMAHSFRHALSTTPLDTWPGVSQPASKWLFFSKSNQRVPHEPSHFTIGTDRRSPKMARLEAVLLVATAPLSARRLAQFATLADASETKTLIERLRAALDEARCSFQIERVGTGYQLMTRPEYVFWLDKLHHRQSRLKLTTPAMETLAIVAYRQPITRADIEVVRGVQSTEMLKQLMERGVVRIVGHDDSLGRPYLYGTTPNFLELFGLKGLDDLPMADRLRSVQPKSTALDSDPPAAQATAEETSAENDAAA